MPLRPDRRQGAPLTARQLETLLVLNSIRATEADAAVSIYQLRDLGSFSGIIVSPMVIGALCDKGLALKRTARRARSQATLYWLTPTGLAEAAAHKKGGRRGRV